jgi:hypothetical protein
MRSFGWAFTQYECKLIEGTFGHTQSEKTRWRLIGRSTFLRLERCICKPRTHKDCLKTEGCRVKEVFYPLSETDRRFFNTLILDFCLQDFKEVNFCYFKSLSFWHFVTAVLKTIITTNIFTIYLLTFMSSILFTVL